MTNLLNLAKLYKKQIGFSTSTLRQTTNNVDIEEVIMIVVGQRITMVKKVISFFIKHCRSYTDDYAYNVMIITRVAHKDKRAYVIVFSHKIPLIAVLSDILSMALPLMISKKSISVNMIAKIFVDSGFRTSSEYLR